MDKCNIKELIDFIIPAEVSKGFTIDYEKSIIEYKDGRKVLNVYLAENDGFVPEEIESPKRGESITDFYSYKNRLNFNEVCLHISHHIWFDSKGQIIYFPLQSDTPELERLSKENFQLSIDSCIEKMNELKEMVDKQKQDKNITDNERFHLEKYVNGIFDDHHIMYELPSLKSKDGLRKYEFVIEFSKNKPSEGIYYGCRGLIIGEGRKDPDAQIKKFNQEWEDIENLITTTLNKSFRNTKKDFSKRFKRTDNAHNFTYWPRWISLEPDEDICQVAAECVKKIRSIYYKYLNYPDGFKALKKIKHKIEPFTEGAYNRLINSIDPSKRKDFITFLDKGIKERFFTEVHKHKEYIVNSKSIEFAFWVKYLNEHFDYFSWDEKLDHFNSNKDSKNISWKIFEDVFKDKDGKPFNEQLKKQYNNNKDHPAKQKFEARIKKLLN